VWLQHDPDSTAKSLLERLHQAYPDRFSEGQLRTLQRRIREWRHVMAGSLVQGIGDGSGADEEPIVVGASDEKPATEIVTKPAQPAACEAESSRV
jgi:hypothetical protein